MQMGAPEQVRGSKCDFLIFRGPYAAVTFPILVENGPFSLIFADFDLSRPLEGRYEPGLVLRRDILVVYGVSASREAALDDHP